MHMTHPFSNENQHQNMQPLNIFKLFTLSIFIATTCFILIGCSSGGSGGESETGVSSALIKGVFVDSPVSGLNYRTDTQSGLTDEKGQFICYSDEMITFMIGDVVLGQAMAGDIITLMDFLEASEQPYDVTHPMVTNMGRFLQSLDADGDPDNGISITEDVRSEVNGRMIDFNQSLEDFEHDPDVIACFDVFNGLNMPRGNMMMWGLTSAEDAQQHMRTYMGDYMPGYMDDHMNFVDSDGDGDIDQPTNKYMGENMSEHMDDQMDFVDNKGDDIIDYPMNENMNGSMDVQMGFVNNDDINISEKSTTENSPALIEGVFIDSPVEGLNYYTETHAGATDVYGRFICYEGELITFMLGDVELGQCLAKDIITPMDFLNESQQPYGLAHPMVTNMCRFLQSLDADGNPDNGITISPEVREEMVGRMINFHQSIEDFENDPGVIACFDVFNGLSMPHSNMAWCLTSSEDAQQHMRTYMGDYMPGYMDNHMNFVDTDIDGDGDVEQPMNGYVGNNMNNHMGMCW